MIIDPTAAGGVTEAKLISGIDDHSRYSVIDKVVPRASARAVCTAFLAAVAEYGMPEEVLSDNGLNSPAGSGRRVRPRCCSSGSAGITGFPPLVRFEASSPTRRDAHFRPRSLMVN